MDFVERRSMNVYSWPNNGNGENKKQKYKFIFACMLAKAHLSKLSIICLESDLFFVWKHDTQLDTINMATFALEKNSIVHDNVFTDALPLSVPQAFCTINRYFKQVDKVVEIYECEQNLPTIIFFL